MGILEGLNSSLTQSAAKIWLAKVGLSGQIVPFLKLFDLLSRTRFSSHKFGSRYASKLIKGSKDVDHSPVSNKR